MDDIHGKSGKAWDQLQLACVLRKVPTLNEYTLPQHITF